MEKKIIAVCLCLPLLLAVTAGCKKENDRLTVVCSVFPVYDWVRNIVGDRDAIDVKLLVDDGSDIHSFQPTAKDAIEIKEADIVIRVGGVDDSFIEELAGNGEGTDLRLMEAEGVTLRQATLGSSHSHSDHSSHDHPTDEHIWLSLKNAAACAEAICGALSELDPDGAAVYRENADKYIEKLTTLDARYAEAVEGASKKYAVFADRFPFVYLAEDHGIEYEAAFEGCTTDAEADFDTIIRLANRLNEWELSYIFVTESSDMRLANAVADRVGDRGISVAILDSMQSVKGDSENATYLGIMENNLDTLSAVLSGKES